jgi:hypothetical protein
MRNPAGLMYSIRSHPSRWSLIWPYDFQPPNPLDDWQPSRELLGLPSRYNFLRAGLNPYPYHHWSHRGLENVVRADVYLRSHDQRSCAGILLEYENGSQVALGEVRLHVDHYVTYLRPQFIGVEMTDTSDGSDMDVLEADDTGKSVFFAQESDMLNEDVDVEWFYMEGELQCCPQRHTGRCEASGAKARDASSATTSCNSQGWRGGRALAGV